MPTLCGFENCSNRSIYNFEGLKPLFCSIHKIDTMINIYAKKCSHFDCKIQPHYNFEGLTAQFCSIHKLESMINIYSKTCNHKGCKTQPHFNFENEKTARFCNAHKLETMTNINAKKCSHFGCKTYPQFNFENEKTARFCSIHKLNNMINIKSKKCSQLNCKIQPHFNFEGLTARFCNAHKLKDMIDINSKKCSQFNCKIRPTFNFENEKTPRFCNAHKSEYMIDIVSKKCIRSECYIHGNRNYRGYCTNCFQHLFPLDPLTFQIRRKTKEIAIRDFINANFEGFQHDRPIWVGGCDCVSRRRIDHRILINNTMLAIETDENQHKYYNKEDEISRYNDLYMSYSVKYIFIRFNPDKYKNENGQTINPMLFDRLNVLKDEIDKQIERINNYKNKDLVEIINLYYDGYISHI